MEHGLIKSEGLQEIDKTQKYILALQNEKEFVKRSYHSGLARYWEIELQTREMQEKFCNLQDDFGAGMVIEDIDGISSHEIMPRDIGFVGK